MQPPIFLGAGLGNVLTQQRIGRTTWPVLLEAPRVWAIPLVHVAMMIHCNDHQLMRMAGESRSMRFW